MFLENKRWREEDSLNAPGSPLRHLPKLRSRTQSAGTGETRAGMAWFDLLEGGAKDEKGSRECVLKTDGVESDDYRATAVFSFFCISVCLLFFASRPKRSGRGQEEYGADQQRRPWGMLLLLLLLLAPHSGNIPPPLVNRRLRRLRRGPLLAPPHGRPLALRRRARQRGRWRRGPRRAHPDRAHPLAERGDRVRGKSP